MRAWILIALLLLSAGVRAKEVCSWDTPGANPFKGRAASAIMSYEQFDWWDRKWLSWRVSLNMQPDERVFIGKKGVHGPKSEFVTDIHDMHFGTSTVCQTITRHSWPEWHMEPASMYCAYIWCIVIPDICKNISWVKRHPPVMRVPEANMLIFALLSVFFFTWRNKCKKNSLT